MTLPLAGIRVLDLSNVLAGPFCGYQLARLGAEVIKVENPKGGDLARRLGADPAMAQAPDGAVLRRRERGQAVRRDRFQGATKARRFSCALSRQADVVLENFRPKVMERLGLGYEVLAKRNPRIVYCAISGFGQDGPWVGRPAYDQIVQGLSGVMSVTGDAETRRPCAPAFRSPTPSQVSPHRLRSRPLWSSSGTTGRGRRSMFRCSNRPWRRWAGWSPTTSTRNVDPQPIGNENFTAAPSGTFATGSGPLNIAANEQKQYEALCDIVGQPELKIRSAVSPSGSRARTIAPR